MRLRKNRIWSDTVWQLKEEATIFEWRHRDQSPVSELSRPAAVEDAVRGRIPTQGMSWLAVVTSKVTAQNVSVEQI